MRAAALVAALACSLSIASAQTQTWPCPNGCSGNGICSGSTCSCFEGWMSGDCSQRKCPLGNAWSDAATADDVAHNLVECSNRGRCDRETGQCVCDLQYTGRACDMSKCPNSCWGRGRCVDMKHFAKYKDPGLGTVYTYESVWDAEKIFGCMCDQGFHGFDCSLRDCPSGDDPMTTGQVDEVQLLQCTATNGFFRLAFRGHTSEPIPVGTTLDTFVTILEAIPGVGDITATFSESGVGICQSTANQVVTITFLEQFGDVGSLVVKSTHAATCTNPLETDLCGGVQVQIVTDGDSLAGTTGGTRFSVTGTKENAFCSRRGRCDTITGVCSCFTNYVTSNGRGSEGNRGDCGYDSAEIQACPGLISCSGHGVCSQAPSYRCTCSVGWASGDCSQRTCASGKAWFDHPIADDRAHQLVECSNMGICDATTGECRCHIGYTGAACDQMECPGVSTSCSGHGTCLTMADLASNAIVNGEFAPVTYGDVPNDPNRWDHDMVHGCMCDEGWEGHDCAKKSCPTGDDPETGWEANDLQVHEVQAVRCTATGGSLRLYFRTHMTDPIVFNAGPSDLREALVALHSITDVEVAYSSGTSLCTSDGSNVATVTFTQQLGDVPMMLGFGQSFGVSLTHSSGTPTLELAGDGTALGGVPTYTGTMENIPCSGRGICDYETGKCKCFNGFGSSNGNRKSGHRGDCGWKIPWAVSTDEEAL